MRATRLSRGLLFAVASACSFADPGAGQATRVLRIGVLDGPPEYTFGRIGGLALYPDGRVVVLDALAGRLRLYDHEGRHVRSFGRPGDGPGEFQGPTAPVISDGEVLVYDQLLRRLVRFSLAGDHIKTEAFAAKLTAFRGIVPLRYRQWIGLEGVLSATDRFALASGHVDADQFGRHGLLFLSGATVDTVASFRDGTTWWYDKEGRSFGPYSESTPSKDLWAVSGDSLVVTVDAARGHIRWHRVRPGSLEVIAERDLGLEPERADVDIGALESFVRAQSPGIGDFGFVTPAYSPHFDQALVGPAGDLWLRWRGHEPGQGRRFLIISPGSGETGEWVAPPGFGLGIIGDEYLWGVYVDEFDVQYVEKHTRPGR